MDSIDDYWPQKTPTKFDLSSLELGHKWRTPTDVISNPRHAILNVKSLSPPPVWGLVHTACLRPCSQALHLPPVWNCERWSHLDDHDRLQLNIVKFPSLVDWPEDSNSEKPGTDRGHNFTTFVFLYEMSYLIWNIDSATICAYLWVNWRWPGCRKLFERHIWLPWS